jgi:N-terminal acetyltransferase B complex non-catalytic subunit
MSLQDHYKSLKIKQAQLLSSGKAVQTPEELFLLTKIYITLGHAQEAVHLLRSENFGLESRFAEQDSQLIMSLLLETLEASEQWTEVFDFCSHLIVEEKYRAFDSINDDRVWHLLFKAAMRSDQTV